MGATTFETYGLGKTPSEAFLKAREHQAYLHGHGGYSGTLAEKNDYVLYTLPPRCTTDKILRLIYEMEELRDIDYLYDDLRWRKQNGAKRAEISKLEAEIRRAEKKRLSFERKNATLMPLLRSVSGPYQDKWGPAVAFLITGAEASRIKKQAGRSGTHDKVFLFCGWASC